MCRCRTNLPLVSIPVSHLAYLLFTRRSCYCPIWSQWEAAVRAVGIAFTDASVRQWWCTASPQQGQHCSAVYRAGMAFAMYPPHSPQCLVSSFSAMVEEKYHKMNALSHEPYVAMSDRHFFFFFLIIMIYYIKLCT